MRSWLSRHWGSILLVLAALFLVGGVAYRELTDDGPPAIVFHAASEAPDGAPIRVSITGAVVSPGEYELRQGDRLTEALSAAGGPAADADIDRLDLSRPVRDGEALLVPAQPRCGVAKAARLDLNAACAAELEALPGIGEAYARRIVDSRLLDGPYGSPEELVFRRVLPQATFDRIRDLVSAAAP
jgi:competence protein ComEA